MHNILSIITLASMAALILGVITLAIALLKDDGFDDWL